MRFEPSRESRDKWLSSDCRRTILKMASSFEMSSRAFQGVCDALFLFPLEISFFLHHQCFANSFWLPRREFHKSCLPPHHLDHQLIHPNFDVLSLLSTTIIYQAASITTHLTHSIVLFFHDLIAPCLPRLHLLIRQPLNPTITAPVVARLLVTAWVALQTIIALLVVAMTLSLVGLRRRALSGMAIVVVPILPLAILVLAGPMAPALTKLLHNPIPGKPMVGEISNNHPLKISVLEMIVPALLMPANCSRIQTMKRSDTPMTLLASPDILFNNCPWQALGPKRTKPGRNLVRPYSGSR